MGLYDNVEIDRSQTDPISDSDTSSSEPHVLLGARRRSRCRAASARSSAAVRCCDENARSSSRSSRRRDRRARFDRAVAAGAERADHDRRGADRDRARHDRVHRSCGRVDRPRPRSRATSIPISACGYVRSTRSRSTAPARSVSTATPHTRRWSRDQQLHERRRRWLQRGASRRRRQRDRDPAQLPSKRSGRSASAPT